jgi:hypothetical protein
MIALLVSRQGAQTFPVFLHLLLPRAIIERLAPKSGA